MRRRSQRGLVGRGGRLRGAGPGEEAEAGPARAERGAGAAAAAERRGRRPRRGVSSEARPVGTAAPARAASEREPESRVRPRGGPFPLASPPSQRALGRCHGPAGGRERAVSRRPLRDAPSEGERRGHGGKRSRLPSHLSPPSPRSRAERRPLPRALHARAAARRPTAARCPLLPPSCPGPARRPRPSPGLSAALGPAPGPPGDPAQSPPPRQRGPVSRRR